MAEPGWNLTVAPAVSIPAIEGRTALVTGAGNGLGRAMAIALSAADAHVVLVGRTAESLHGTAELLAGESTVLTCDVADPSSVAALADHCDLSAVSILVNNAGVAGPVAPIHEIEPDEWDEVFAVNVRGPYLMCKLVLPHMIDRSFGQIVNIASVTGKRPLARRTPYSASKIALIGLTRTLAFEVGHLGILVNSLSPGPVRGPRMARNFRLEAQRTGTTEAEAEEAYVSRAAQHRLVEEWEVGEALVALLRMPGLTGADIDLSAGMIAP